MLALGSSGTNVPLIIAIQTLRLFAVVASGPPLARLIAHVTRNKKLATPAIS